MQKYRIQVDMNMCTLPSLDCEVSEFEVINGRLPIVQNWDKHNEIIKYLNSEEVIIYQLKKNKVKKLIDFLKELSH